MLIVYDDLCAQHLKGIPHPESPDRVTAAAAFLRARGMLDAPVSARDASMAEIERVHDAQYVAGVRHEVARLQGHAGYLSTGDTVVDSGSFEVALRAAGGAVVAAERAYEGCRATFALVRPPGHHAEAARGMGFCVFNNAAVAARAIQARTGARVLIADFDYHHGNGTQAIAGGGLSYVSAHAFPAYPGTGGPGDSYELGSGDAVLNLPVPPHAFGTEAFVALWDALLPLAASRVKPDMLVVSAGFDYVAGDPVGDLDVEVGAAAQLAALINRTAAQFCRGRVAYVLEGGYNTGAIARSIASIAEVSDARSMGESGASPRAIPDAQRELLQQL